MESGTYEVNEDVFNKLIDYCKTNLRDFKTFLEDNYSSRSGFVSFFATEPKKWFEEYLKDDSDKFERAFAGILNFVLSSKDYSVDDMLDDVADETTYIEVLTSH